MNTTLQAQIFFLPTAITHQAALLHSSCFNLAHNLLQRSDLPYVVVPIPGMQYLAIVEAGDIWFVDSEQQTSELNPNGKLITLSWHPHLAESRSSLDQHIPMDVVFYAPGLEQVQQRLTGEFYKGLMLLDAEYSQTTIPTQPMIIMPLEK